MWLSRQMTKTADADAPAALGTISVAGQRPAAVTDTEHRDLCLICPGGYHWVPADADEVMVLHAAPDAVIGQAARAPVSLEPREVCIYSGGCSIVLRNNGDLHLNGNVLVNGVRIGGGDGK